MESPGLKDRFSRQTILPGVGVEGQAKWESSSVLLAGEDAALEAAQTALSRSGLANLTILDKSKPKDIPPSSLILILTGDADWRRLLNRQIRMNSQPALFAWASGFGFSLFAKGAAKGCPCLECFEVSNPKAFTVSKDQSNVNGESTVARMMGAMAATEALQWILKGASPLEGLVWMNSFEDGLSLRHEVTVSTKCPARLAVEGMTITP